MFILFQIKTSCEYHRPLLTPFNNLPFASVCSFERLILAIKGIRLIIGGFTFQLLIPICNLKQFDPESHTNGSMVITVVILDVYLRRRRLRRLRPRTGVADRGRFRFAKSGFLLIVSVTQFVQFLHATGFGAACILVS